MASPRGAASFGAKTSPAEGKTSPSSSRPLFRPPFRHLRQTSVVLPGVQPWSRRVLASDGARTFAYASTGSVFIFNLDDANPRVRKLLFAHESTTITAIACPTGFQGLLVTAAADGSAAVWNVESEKRVYHLIGGDDRDAAGVTTLDVSPQADRLRVALASSLGVFEWVPSQGKRSRICAGSGRGRPSVLQYNPGQRGRGDELAVGRTDGRIEMACFSGGKWTVRQLKDPPKAKATSKDPIDCGEVLDLRWDPLSQVYLLALHGDGTIFLWGMDEKHPTVHATIVDDSLAGKNKLGVGSTRSIAWLPWEPGNFVTVSSRSGLVKVFNVSNDTPLSVHRVVDDTGFCFLQRLAAAESAKGRPVGSVNRSFDGGADAEALGGAATSTTFNVQRGAISSFLDGSIGLIDLDRKALVWRSQAGHRETIFDARFCPANCDILATSSYDSTVKIWHTNTMSVQLTLRAERGDGGLERRMSASTSRGDTKGSFFDPNRQIRWSASARGSNAQHVMLIVYSISWERGGRKIALGLSTGSVQVWSIDGLPVSPHRRSKSKAGAPRGRTKPRGKLCSGGKGVPSLHKGPVFCVDWSPFEHVWYSEDGAGESHAAQGTEYGGLIASSSGDRCVVLSTANGHVVCVERLPNTVFGCHWNRLRPGALATACADGKIRIYHLKRNRGNGRRGGNSGGSGDRDGTRKFSGASLSLAACLSGHSKSTFRAVWSPHSSTLLASSSNDRTIRVWDTRKTTCASSRSRSSSNASVAVLRGHRHHVRGLLFHSEYPEIIVSGSWDNTIRVWNFTLDGGTCLEIVKCHSADVYGLDAHPDRPFTMVSSSRDSTLRFWKFDSPATVVSRISAMLGLPWEDLVDVSQNAARRRSHTRIDNDIKVVMTRSKSGAWVDPQPVGKFKQRFSGSEATKNYDDGDDGGNGGGGRAAASGTGPLSSRFHFLKLAGHRSREIMKKLRDERGHRYGMPYGGQRVQGRNFIRERLMDAQHLRLILDFFGMPEGGNDLWKAVESNIRAEYGRSDVSDALYTSEEIDEQTFFKVVAGGSAQSRPAFLHRSRIVRAALRRAKRLVSSKNFIKADTDAIDRAVGLLSHVGRLKEACELLISGSMKHVSLDDDCRGSSYDDLDDEVDDDGHVPQWDRALALAPGVSLAFWESLRRRRLRHLSKATNERRGQHVDRVADKDNDTEIRSLVDVSALRAGQGDIGTLTRELIQRGEFWNALLVLQADNELLFHIDDDEYKSIPRHLAQRLRRDIVQGAASRCLEQGSAVSAACCYVAVEDGPCYRAVSALVQADEIELAYGVAIALGQSDDELLPLVEALVFRRLEPAGDGAIEDVGLVESGNFREGLDEQARCYPDGGVCLLDSYEHLELSMVALQHHGSGNERVSYLVQELCARAFRNHRFSVNGVRMAVTASMTEALRRRALQRQRLFDRASLRTPQQYLDSAEDIAGKLVPLSKVEETSCVRDDETHIISLLSQREFEQHKTIIRYLLLAGEFERCARRSVDLVWHLLDWQHGGELFRRRVVASRSASVYTCESGFTVMRLVESLPLNEMQDDHPLLFAQIHVLAFYFAAQRAMMLGYTDLAQFFLGRRRLLLVVDKGKSIGSMNAPRPSEAMLLLQEAQYLVCAEGGSNARALVTALGLLDLAKESLQQDGGQAEDGVATKVDELRRSLLVDRGVKSGGDDEASSSSTLDAGSGSKDSMPDHGDDRAIGASVRVEARRGPNHILVSGQTLPSGHHARSGVSETVSCITGRSISGPVVLLEDGASMMSLSEAVMYIRCTRWSPLCTGLRLSWV